MAFLPIILILLSTAVFIVMLFKRLQLSPVLGYLVAGTMLGDYGLNLVSHKDTHALAEFGVVFLLFAIGLELTFDRLKSMRKYVFGFGSLQVVISAIVIGFAVLFLKGDARQSLIIGGGLALSSTAIVLQVIAESRAQSTQVGRLALAILLLQDFAVVPLLVIIPILGEDASSIMGAIGMSMAKAFGALVTIFILGRMFFRPIFNLITSANMAKSNELFIATTLLIALSAAWSTEYMGLSLALGAFVAGILVAETEFQVQAEESIAPFKGLLLGLFFMTVGMTIDVRAIYHEMDKILLFSFGLILIKAIIITTLCIFFGFSKAVALHAGLLLAQGSEFAFILFNLAILNNLIDEELGRVLLFVVTFTMALTPLLSAIGEKIAKKLDVSIDKSPVELIKQGAQDLSGHVVIAGFGDVGKMVAKMLEAESLNYIAIDINEATVKEESENGFPVFKGDAGSLATLHAAGLERATSIIISMDNEITRKKALKIISSTFSQVAIVVRAPNLMDAESLYDLGATIIVPEDYEAGLQLGGAVLKSVGISEFEISRMKNRFRAGNYTMAMGEEEEEVPVS
jgi:CPA2 family monovalent cation:H+ antiporter-2